MSAAAPAPRVQAAVGGPGGRPERRRGSEWRPARGLGERPGSLGLVPVYFRMPRKRFLSCPSPQVQVVTITPVRPDKLHNVAGIIQGVGSPDRHRGVEVSFLCFRCYHRSSERRRGHHLAACTGLRVAHGAVFSIPGDSPPRPGRDAGGRKTWAPGCARPGFAEWPCRGLAGAPASPPSAPTSQGW